MELTPILAELGYDEKRSFNGLLQVTTDGGPSIGESQKVRGLWYAVAIWVKDGPGMGKLLADWITDGRTEIDHHSIDYARFYPFQTEEGFIEARCYESAFKIYNPAVHPREPYAGGRGVRQSPFYEREKELGGYFMELGGWERAHGYASNEHLLEKYGNQVPLRENEWDNRHFWRVSNAEHLEMSANVGMINLSHFAMYDVTGPDHVAFMERLCVAKVGGDNQVGKGIYTHFLDEKGMVKADFTVFRMADRFRFVDGADAGNRDFVYMKRMAEDLGYDVEVDRRLHRLHHHRPLGAERPGDPAEGGGRPGEPHPRELPLCRHQADRDRRQVRRRLPHLLRRRAGLGAAHEVRGRPRRLGCHPRARTSCPSVSRPTPTPAGWRRACACRTPTC